MKKNKYCLIVAMGLVDPVKTMVDRYHRGQPVGGFCCMLYLGVQWMADRKALHRLTPRILIAGQHFYPPTTSAPRSSHQPLST